MARKAEQINKKTIKALTQAMEELGQKYSIRVGIQGSKAYETHKDSKLTNAQLGAIHEFGAVINVTDKMRGFFRKEFGINLKKSTTQIVIPARSFLRETLLSKEGKERLMYAVGLSSDNAELNVEIFKLGLMKNSGFMDELAEIIGANAVHMVETSFEVGGYPVAWQPISNLTRATRKNDPTSKPLTDSGDLKHTITAEVKKSG